MNLVGQLVLADAKCADLRVEGSICNWMPVARSMGQQIWTLLENVICAERDTLDTYTISRVAGTRINEKLKRPQLN